MGLDAILTVIPAAEYRKLRADPLHYVPVWAGEFDLYRDWKALDASLNRMGNPLALAIRGNRPEREAFDGAWETYGAFATAGLVRRIDKALASVTANNLLVTVKDAGRRLKKSEQRGFVSALKALKAAYRSAAKKNACLSILIC